ncbi:MAG: glutamate-1-semialdehyde 2,1-aminomutase, partial [Chloroflexota bacterium]
MKTDMSKKLFAEARELIPGGVDSPVRAFRAVGGQPLFIDRASGSRIFDVDGNSFVDYVGSWGPLILGHAHPGVVQAVQRAAERGTSYGAPTSLESDLARAIVEAVPTIEMVRFVNSGTEAVMSALRLARAYTGRDRVIKFAGCYHGHADGLLVQAGSGATTLGIPDSPGVPAAAAQMTLSLPYNDEGAVEEAFRRYPEEIAAVIVEPVAGNMGVVPPKSGFLQALRRITQGHGALLIFDEVIAGFRVSYGGAQALYGIAPDLTTMGKIIGGGLPVGAYGGTRAIMERVSPAGPVYQAGTLSGNPLAMTAGIETLRQLRQPGAYERLDQLSARLCEGLGEAALKAGKAVFQTRVGSMSTTYFTPGPVVDYASALTSDAAMYGRFFRGMLERGFYFAPSQYEAT